MKKLKLKLDFKEMLSKDQMRKIVGGDYCSVIPDSYYAEWYCCPAGGPTIDMGYMNCDSAQYWCRGDNFTTDPTIFFCHS